MSLPNLLTIIRFLLIPIYLFIFFSDLHGRMYWALSILLLAGLTDVIDGYLARRMKQVTQLGIMLDPLADKLMMIAVFLSLLISAKISVWAALAFLIRDIAMIVGSFVFHFRGKKTVPANVLGKITTVLFYVALVLLLFSIPHGQTFMWFVILLSYLTSIVYILQLKSVNE